MTPNEKSQLLTRLAQSEDPWVERKKSYNERDVKRTIVGFANSVAEGQEAVLFIGAENSGQHSGVADADDLQKKISGHVGRCYPPIKYQTCVLPVESGGKDIEILAVIVPYSENRPHFSGPAYIRKGSETQKASAETFQELIASQNDKARRILQFKGKRCGLKFKSKSGFWYNLDCIVESCDAHSVNVRDTESYLWTIPIPQLEIQSTPMHALEIIAEPLTPEDEHIRSAVRRWAFVLAAHPSTPTYHLPEDWLVKQLLANPTLALPVVAGLADSSEDHWLRLLHLHLRFAVKKREASMPKHQKVRRLEAHFFELMKGSHPASNSSLIGATVHSIVEVATSVSECEEFLAHLAAHNANLGQLPQATIWSALLYELKF
jgi:hypothetical protein